LERKYPGVKIKNVRGAVLDISAGVSGGTIASALNLLETFSFKELGAAFKPFGISPCKPENSVQQSSVLYDERMGGWIGPWLMSETNAAVVCRTYGLLGGKWGDKFAYKEYLNWGSWLKCYGYVSVSGVVSACLAIPPVRWLAKKVLPGSGDGPSEEKMKNGNVTLKIVADTDEVAPRSGSITCQGDADPAYLLTGIHYEGLA
jgi:short subunit dehydrogenase-like uncharacterized protein